MRSDRSIQLFRIFGIRIGASPSWFVVLFLMIYWLSGYFGDVLVGESNSTAFLVAVLATLLFFVSLLLHELGHALTARHFGIGTSGIDLWLFGGVAKLTRDSNTPKEEFLVAAAGPAVTGLIVLVCAGLGALASKFNVVVDIAQLQTVGTTPAIVLIGWLGAINLVLLIFNLIPAFPLDGGRIARAVAWRMTGDRNRGTRFSGKLGIGFSWLLIGGGALIAARGDLVSGAWLALLGWFLGSAARSAVLSSRFSERLDEVTAGDLMDRDPLTIPGSVSVIAAREEWFDRHPWPWFAVVDAQGRLEGVLDETTLARALADGRPALPVRDVLDPAAQTGVWVTQETPVGSLLGSEGVRRLGAILVVDDHDRLCGVVSAERLGRAISAAAASHSGPPAV